jgi:hypothetical protein
MRCLPGGCFAAIALKDAAIRQFLKAAAPARIVYVNAAKREVVDPLSFKASVRPLTRCKSNSRRGVKTQWQSAPLPR